MDRIEPYPCPCSGCNAQLVVGCSCPAYLAWVSKISGENFSEEARKSAEAIKARVDRTDPRD